MEGTPEQVRNAGWRTKVTALQETSLQPWSAAGVSKRPNYSGEIYVKLRTDMS